VGIRVVSSIVGILFYNGGVGLASSKVVLLDFTSFLDLFIVTDFFIIEDLSIRRSFSFILLGGSSPRIS